MQKEYPNDETVLYERMYELWNVNTNGNAHGIMEIAKRLLDSLQNNYRYGAIQMLCFTNLNVKILGIPQSSVAGCKRYYTTFGTVFLTAVHFEKSEAFVSIGHTSLIVNKFITRILCAAETAKNQAAYFLQKMEDKRLDPIRQTNRFNAVQEKLKALSN